MNAIQFDFQFDAQKILQELQAIKNSFNTIHSIRIKENDLKGFHLIEPSPNGKKDERGLTYQTTPELDKSPYLQSILDTFQCDKFTFRIHNLVSKGKIELHRDTGSGLLSNIVRIHIPVTTNDEVYFYVDGERVCMKNGECWHANVTLPHEVENRSNNDRLQLMIDCDLNEWWKNILKKHGVELNEISLWDSHTLKELQAIKENFLMMETDASQELIKELDLAIAKKPYPNAI